MLRQAKVYTTRLSEAEDAEVWQELANNREAVTEGSQGQPRSGAAPGTWTIQPLILPNLQVGVQANQETTRKPFQWFTSARFFEFLLRREPDHFKNH